MVGELEPKPVPSWPGPDHWGLEHHLLSCHTQTHTHKITPLKVSQKKKIFLYLKGQNVRCNTLSEGGKETQVVYWS